MTDPPSRRLSDLSRVIHREVVLLVLLTAVAAGVFLFTHWAAASNRTRQSADALSWFERGRARLTDGRTGEAVRALERAVARRPDDWAYATMLVEALVADGQVGPARQVLLRWRLRRPEDAEVDIQLARLEAADGHVTAATEYYESALHGRWPETGSESRLDLRRELIRYQLRHGQTGPALAQALVLAANVPDAPDAHIETGRLFLATGDAARALDHFVRALRLDPGNVAARVGATEAAFAQGDYAGALAHARGLTDQPSRARASIAAAVIAADPLEPRLSFGERERRLGRVIDDALLRFTACRQRSPEPTPLARRTADGLANALAAFRADLSPQRLRESSDVIERGLRLAEQALASVRQRCPRSMNAATRCCVWRGATERRHDPGDHAADPGRPAAAREPPVLRAHPGDGRVGRPVRRAVLPGH